MLTKLCSELRNYFIKSDKDKKIGTFTISNGVIAPFVDIKDKQYYRIVGSLYNDKVYQHNIDDLELKDEEFDGAIWLMYVPTEVIELSEKIQNWQDKYSDITNSPFSAESYGGYSYTKATTSTGSVNSWQDAFKSELNKWRKI